MARVLERWVLVSTLLTAAGFGALAVEPEAPLWSIGVFDESSAEFRPWVHAETGERLIDYADPRSDGRVRVGSGQETVGWPAYQPGSSNGGAGFREHPGLVEFVMGRAPEQDLELRLSLLAYSARLPVVQVGVNGRRGWWYQQPRPTSSAGDPAVFFQPHYSSSPLRCRLPASWFRAGTNRLEIVAVDVPGDREDVRPAGFPWPGCSGLVYDAMALHETTESAVPVEVRVEPTIFHRLRDGRLMEEVDVVVRRADRAPKGRMRVTMGEARAEAEFGSERERDAGEARVTMELPAWEGERELEVRLEFGGEVREFRRTVAAGRRWRLWWVAHEHLDIGYTDYDAKVAELHARVVDDAMELAERHPDFSLTLDGFWVVDRYRAGRTDGQVARMVRAVREGRIHVPVVHGSLFTGSATLEGLVRGLYPSRAFAREHGTPFDVAIVTDVPSYAWSWASVLAASGVKYFVGASDAYRGPFLLRNRLHELGAHRWEGPDGASVITCYSRHYHQASSLFGLPPRRVLGRESLPRFLRAYDHPAHPGNDVILYGSQVENVALNREQAGFVEAWNREYAFPRLKFGGFAEAMRAVIGDRSENALTRVRGDGGPYWEDGLAANARVTARAREYARRLVSAEKLATAASGWNPKYRVDRADLDAAWEAVRLIDEHTWHADCSVRDPGSEKARRQGEAKDARADELKRAAERVSLRAMSAIADAVPVGPGTLMVFNPLSWPRSGDAEVEIGRGQALVDLETGATLGMEVLREGRVYRTVRFEVPTVPAMGFRSLGLRPAVSEARVAPLPEPSVLETPHYRVLLDVGRGGIRSIVDRATRRELVDDRARFALGQWVYVTGGDELPNRLVQFGTASPIPSLTEHGAEGGRLVSATSNRWGVVARMESRSRGAPTVETEVALPWGRKEIRVTVRVTKEATLAKEAAYVAFPWAVVSPRFRYATQNGFVDPARDVLTGGCLEWFAVQDWLAVDGGGVSVWMSAVDAPLVTLGDIVRGTWPETFGTRPAAVFGYVMSNYTPEGYAAAQGGAFEFRYRITSREAFDAGEVARWGAETMTPFETVEVTRNDKRSIESVPGTGPATRDGALVVEPSTVHLVAWKSAERTDMGTIVRLLETTGSATEARIAWVRGRPKRATLCTAVEDDVRELPIDGDSGVVRVPVAGFGIATVRLEP